MLMALFYRGYDNVFMDPSLCIYPREFEMLGVDVLDVCYQTDPEKAAMLIEMRYKNWGDMSCLDLAAAADCKVRREGFGWSVCFTTVCS